MQICMPVNHHEIVKGIEILPLCITTIQGTKIPRIVQLMFPQFTDTMRKLVHYVGNILTSF